MLAFPFLTACSSSAPGDEVDDSWIVWQVNAALTGDPELRPFEIAADSRRGVVRLMGSVETEEQRLRAAKIARRVGGVKRVVNRIHLEAAKGGPS